MRARFGDAETGEVDTAKSKRKPGNSMKTHCQIHGKFVDLFDFDPKHSRAGVGIIIFSEENKGKGYAFEALQLINQYAVKHLNIHQLYANITEDNTQSIKLFKKAGYAESGMKKDWIKSGKNYKNELFYQLIHDVH